MVQALWSTLVDIWLSWEKLRLKMHTEFDSSLCHYRDWPLLGFRH
jgi:hypothetical protein